MRIVFIGASGFGLRALDAIRKLPECEVVGSVTAPRNFAISYRPEGVHNVLHADVMSYCAAASIPCMEIKDGMREVALREQVAAWRPDAFIVVGWYHILPASWRQLAPAYGLHASLLPDYSGGAPLVWAMINGETRTGITLFQLGSGVDNGPVVAQCDTEILAEDTIATLYARIEAIGVRLLQEHLPRLAGGSAVLTVQDERRRRTFPQRAPEDGEIDWSWPAVKVRNWIRAQTHPYPGAFSMLCGSKVTIWAATQSDYVFDRSRPGVLHCDSGRAWVVCGDGEAVELLEVSVAGEPVAVSQLAALLAEAAP